MPNEIPLHINFDVYSGQLTSEIDSHLIALKSVFRTIDDGSYAVNQTTDSGIFKMNLVPPNPEFLKKQEINKCFKSVVTSLQDFMDRLIGILNMSRNKIPINKKITTNAELEQLLLETENHFIQEVAKDKTLKAPKKLDILEVDDPLIRAMVDGYFAVRNSIEHHKGIADRDINLVYRKFTFLLGDKEILSLPFQVTESLPLMLGTKDESRIIPNNSEIVISLDEIENVAQTIKIFVSLGMAQKAVEMMNVSKA